MTPNVSEAERAPRRVTGAALGGGNVSPAGPEGAILAAIHQAIIATDLDGRITYWNKFAESLYGWTAAEAVGRNIVEVTPADVSRDMARDIMKRLAGGETWAGEFTVRDKAGRSFLTHVTNAPIADQSGRLVGVLGMSVLADRRHDAQLESINRELKHHIQNLFAVASAIVTQSLRSDPALTELRQRIVGRLRAIAAAHDVVSAPSEDGADLRALVGVLVMPFAPAPDRIVVHGPSVYLPTRDTTSLALILHELATNALKHGAWAGDRGTTTIGWSVGDDRRLRIDWRENVQLASAEVSRVGLGTALINRGLPRGTVAHALTPNGLICSIDLPIV